LEKHHSCCQSAVAKALADGRQQVVAIIKAVIPAGCWREPRCDKGPGKTGTFFILKPEWPAFGPPVPIVNLSSIVLETRTDVANQPPLKLWLTGASK